MFFSNKSHEFESNPRYSGKNLDYNPKLQRFQQRVKAVY